MKLSSAQVFGLAAALMAPDVWAATPPTIVCSAEQVLECTSSNGASAVLQATVRDVDGDALLVVWAFNGHAALTNALGAGSTSNGVIKVHWDLTDERGNKRTNDSFDSVFRIALPDSGRSQAMKGP